MIGGAVKNIQDIVRRSRRWSIGTFEQVAENAPSREISVDKVREQPTDINYLTAGTARRTDAIDELVYLRLYLPERFCVDPNEFALFLVEGYWSKFVDVASIGLGLRSPMTRVDQTDHFNMLPLTC
jgi:hypothetical protein